MSGPSEDRDPGSEAHVDAISEIEAEFEADAPDLEELAHLPRPHSHLHGRSSDHPDGSPDPRPPAAPAVAPDTVGSAPPPNDRAGRQRFLVAYLRIALAIAFVVGVLELVLPVDARDEVATVMVAVFIAAPVGRVAWLMVRWARLRDWRFALVGAALLAVVATSFLVR